jgi:hypothetical protein
VATASGHARSDQNVGYDEQRERMLLSARRLLIEMFPHLVPAGLEGSYRTLTRILVGDGGHPRRHAGVATCEGYGRRSTSTTRKRREVGSIWHGLIMRCFANGHQSAGQAGHRRHLDKAAVAPRHLSVCVRGVQDVRDLSLPKIPSGLARIQRWATIALG